MLQVYLPLSLEEISSPLSSWLLSLRSSFLVTIVVTKIATIIAVIAVIAVIAIIVTIVTITITITITIITMQIPGYSLCFLVIDIINIITNILQQPTQT